MTGKSVFIGKDPDPSLITMLYIIYGLHAVSAITGVLTSAFIVTAFLTGWPSIIALILSYIKRSDADATFLESHFHWVINTFWYALLALIVSGLLALTIIGIPVSIILVALTGLWVLYRIIRGLIKLSEREALPLN